jgi:hypothetical protein
MDARKKQAKASKDKNPLERRNEKVTADGFKSVERSVKPVAKDTNKTRRKSTLARKESANATVEKPGSTLKRDMKKPMMNKKAGSLKCRKM